MAGLEACGKGLWRLRKNVLSLPPSDKKWVHVAGPYYREASTQPTLLDLLRVASGQAPEKFSESFTPSSRE